MSVSAIALHDPLLDGNAQAMDVTRLIEKTWRRSTRRIGGYWLGTCEIKAKDVGRGWLDEMFTYGVLREIRERAGGEETWRGMLLKMEYTSQGDLFTRDITNMANAIKSIYTSIGDNLLTNGSGESGALTAYNGATVTQDATWASHGTYSVKIVVADTAIRGWTVQSGISIAAGKQYVLRATLMVTGGSWRIALNRSDNDQSLAFFSTGGRTGDMVMDVSVPETNTYAGTAVLRISSEAAVGVINVDAMVLQLAPIRAETGWYTDATSIAVYGRKEEVLLRGGKSGPDANAECQSMLLDRAWANPTPPDNSKTWLKQTAEDTLRLTFAGYWATLNWINTTLHGTRSCGDWVSALAALQSTYVTPYIVESNTTDYLVDDRGPLKVGDLLRDLTLSGASGGSKYAIGVYNERRLIYEQVPQTLSYIRRGGRLYNVAGGELEPWLARPGWCLWQDMPLGAGTLTTNPQHDPRWVYLEEVEMVPNAAEPSGYEIAFKLV